MSALLLLLAGVACAGLGLLAPPRWAFALLTGVIVLVPATLVVPNGFSPLPTFVRVATVTVAIGLLVRRGGRDWTPTPVHVGAALLAVGTLVTGVALALPELSISELLQAWASVVEPLVVFAVAVACVRATADLRHVLRVLAAVALLAAALGALEHVSGRSLGGFLFSLSGSQAGETAALPLEQRAGQTRVRVGQEFALAYAWVLAALLPAVLAAPWRRLRGLVPLAGAGLLVLAAYWSFSRSAPIALAVALTAFAVLLRDRRATAVLVAALLAGSLAAVTAPTLTSRFEAAVDQGALDVRAERRPVVLEAAAERPLQGLGLSGISTLDLSAVDQSYLLTYTETGVVGVVLLVGAVGCGVAVAGRGARGPRSPGRTACSVAVSGAVVLLVAGLAFDALAVRGTADLLWLLLAVGVAAAEQARSPLRAGLPRTGLSRRTAVVAGGVVTGAVLSAAWPSSFALSTDFRTLSTQREAGLYDPIGTGRVLVRTVCGVAQAVAADDVSVDCRLREPAAGVGSLRIAAPSEQQVLAALERAVVTTRDRTRVDGLRLDVSGPPVPSVPTAVRTAPVSLGLAGLLLALLVPGQRREPGARGRSGRVDAQQVGPGTGREVGPWRRVAQQRDERVREAV